MVFNWLESKLIKVLGPGILMAGAAVGVSHLVQATRAGADYGFALLWLLVIAVITKLPFLEFGPRYAAATGNHLIYGYKKMGVLYFGAYVLITLGTMFIILASVTVVTAGIAEYIFGFGLSPFYWSLIILTICAGLLVVGRYPGLDFVMKVIISLLTICTLIAVLLALGAGASTEVATIPPPSYWNLSGLAFIIAFMGWMPIPLDSSVWHSIYTKERATQTGYAPTVKESLIDFHIGYWAASLIGLLFLILGALIMFGTGVPFSANSVEFSSQLIELYGRTLGGWSMPILAVAALITMFSTTLAVLDAYPRVVMESFATAGPGFQSDAVKQRIYFISLGLIPAFSLAVLFFLNVSFTALIDFTAGLSFLAAPLLGWFNLKLITSNQVATEHQPGKAYLYYSRICLAVLLLFSGVYLYWRFFV